MTVRIFFKLSSMLLLCSAAAILLIRAQPYQDTALMDFLAPRDGCQIPCFMGITPGRTRLREALAVLLAHEWVSEVDATNSPSLTWTWSGLQPDIINPESKGALYARGESQLVWDIAIRTTLPVASMYLISGGPHIIDHPPNQITGNLLVSAGYPELSVVAFTQLSCPASTRQYWESWLGLQFRRRFQINPINNIELRC